MNNIFAPTLFPLEVLFDFEVSSSERFIVGGRRAKVLYTTKKQKFPFLASKPPACMVSLTLLPTRESVYSNFLIFSFLLRISLMSKHPQMNSHHQSNKRDPIQRT